NFLVAVALCDLLVAPVRERMRADRRDFQSSFGRQLSKLAAEIDNVRARVLDRIANLRTQLDHRLMHLRLDLLFQNHLAALEDLLNIRTQLARFRIDNREFLFDTEGECVLLRAHRRQQVSPKNKRLSSRVAETT